MTAPVTFREWCFGPTPPITPADAARALGDVRRRADRERVSAMTATLKAGVARGEVASLGWKA